MPEVTVLRVEIIGDKGGTPGSLESGKGGTSSSIVAGAVGGGLVGKMSAGSYSNALNEMGSGNGPGIGNRGETKDQMKAMRTMGRGIMKSGLTGRDWATNGAIPKGSRLRAIGTGAQVYATNLPGGMVKGGVGLATSAGAVYSLYSAHKQATLQMSGASHAASVQARKGQATNQLLGLGAAAIINPALAIPMIITKLYQLEQTNRKENFEIKKSIMQSTVLQRNLVKNVAESRF